MEELLIKLHREQQEVIHNINKLLRFRESEDYKNLSAQHKGLLDIQLSAMRTYVDTLSARCVDIEINLNTEIKETESEAKIEPDRILIIISDKKD